MAAKGCLGFVILMKEIDDTLHCGNTSQILFASDVTKELITKEKPFVYYGYIQNCDKNLAAQYKNAHRVAFFPSETCDVTLSSNQSQGSDPEF